jgi:hypothetical protein
MKWHLTFLDRVLALVSLFVSALVGSVALLGSPAAEAQSLRLQLLAQDLTAPIHLEELPDGTGRMLIVQ